MIFAVVVAVFLFASAVFNIHMMLNISLEIRYFLYDIFFVCCLYVVFIEM